MYMLWFPVAAPAQDIVSRMMIMIMMMVVVVVVVVVLMMMMVEVAIVDSQDDIFYLEGSHPFPSPLVVASAPETLVRRKC